MKKNNIAYLCPVALNFMLTFTRWIEIENILLIYW